MSEANEILAIARDWVQKGENDLKNAIHTVGMRKDCPTDTVCFHAQQCVEKYSKAFLVLKRIDFPKTHDIKELIALLPSDARPKMTPEEQRRLTDYATVTRYPGDYELISLAEARRAVKIARRVRNEMRKLLPKEMLPK
jgi:HEPN domain-containing protein